MTAIAENCQSVQGSNPARNELFLPVTPELNNIAHHELITRVRVGWNDTVSCAHIWMKHRHHRDSVLSDGRLTASTSGIQSRAHLKFKDQKQGWKEFPKEHSRFHHQGGGNGFWAGEESKYTAVAQLQSCAWLFEAPWTVAHQAPLSMEFLRQEYWGSCQLLLQGALPKPGIKPLTPASPALASRLFITEPCGKPEQLQTKMVFKWQLYRPYLTIVTSRHYIWCWWLKDETKWLTFVEL